jgi:6-pyruvoyltetrahydropterin/6-carboxytetrahydropterin synthase
VQGKYNNLPAVLFLRQGQGLCARLLPADGSTKPSLKPNSIIFAAVMVYVTRVEHFNAAHKLFNPAWSKAENEAAFGPCANENWHGHNYEIHVTVKGTPHPDTGFIIDVKKLSKIIKTYVLDEVDHKNLNVDVPFMAGKLASTENFVMEIWKQLAPNMQGGVLHQIRLYETPRIYVDYYGEAT